jgi:hypothetical protein
MVTVVVGRGEGGGVHHGHELNNKPSDDDDCNDCYDDEGCCKGIVHVHATATIGGGGDGWGHHGWRRRGWMSRGG